MHFLWWRFCTLNRWEAEGDVMTSQGSDWHTKNTRVLQIVFSPNERSFGPHLQPSSTSSPKPKRNRRTSKPPFLSISEGRPIPNANLSCFLPVFVWNDRLLYRHDRSLCKNDCSLCKNDCSLSRHDLYFLWKGPSFWFDSYRNSSKLLLCYWWFLLEWRPWREMKQLAFT